MKLGFVTPMGKIYITEELEMTEDTCEYPIPCMLLDGRGLLLVQLLVYEDENYLIKSPIEEYPVFSSVDDMSCPGVSDESLKSLAMIFEELEKKSDMDHIHDGRYYTETETDGLLSGKSDKGHTHDDRYYTEDETDEKLRKLKTLKISASLSGSSVTGFSATYDEILSAVNEGREVILSLEALSLSGDKHILTAPLNVQNSSDAGLFSFLFEKLLDGNKCISYQVTVDSGNYVSIMSEELSADTDWNGIINKPGDRKTVEYLLSLESIPMYKSKDDKGYHVVFTHNGFPALPDRTMLTSYFTEKISSQSIIGMEFYYNDATAPEGSNVLLINCKADTYKEFQISGFGDTSADFSLVLIFNSDGTGEMITKDDYTGCEFSLYRAVSGGYYKLPNEALELDSVPTKDSVKPVTSDGIRTAIEKAVSEKSEVYIVPYEADASVTQEELPENTYDSLKNAYSEGKQIYIRMYDSDRHLILLPLNFICEPEHLTSFYFSTVYDGDFVMAYTVGIHEDNTVTVTSEKIMCRMDMSDDTASAENKVISVNGKIGEVILTAPDVHALPDTTIIPTVPGNVSAFNNDARYITDEQLSEIVAQFRDFVVEQGTSEHWTYRKWASGIAECWGSVKLGEVEGSVQDSTIGWYISPEQREPFPTNLFITVPLAFGGAFPAQGKSLFARFTLPSKNNAYFRLLGSVNDFPNAGTVVNIFAKGKWK